MDPEKSKISSNLDPERPDPGTARTLMAADRTLMAWVRTGLSMLTFGFAIYKFLVYVKESLSDKVTKPEGPRHFAIVLIALGTMSMLFGLIDHHRTFEEYGKSSGRTPWNFAFFTGTIVALLGTVLLVTMLIHRDVF
jgi:putative membrane protein